MAAWLNKWLLFSLIPFYFNMSGLKEGGKPGENRTIAHPLHLSVTEINHNAADATLEISCKIFTDDFERILRKNFPEKSIDLINPPDRQAMNAMVNEYISKRLQIKADGRAVGFTCIGFEQEEDATFSYFQVDNISAVKKVELTNSILHDLFTDQANINHIIVGGKRKSSKLDQPKTTVVETF